MTFTKIANGTVLMSLLVLSASQVFASDKTYLGATYLSQSPDRDVLRLPKCVHIALSARSNS